MDFPKVIPIFALPNVVLFPGIPLPLHIFEMRYRDMVSDAAAKHEIIGMTLLRGDWQKEYEGTPPIFDNGCAGRIASLQKLPDGRFNILLHGLREFVIVRHIYEKSYRQAEVAWRPRFSDALPPLQRENLRATLLRFLPPAPESAMHKLLRDPSLSDELFVNFMSFALDIDPLEKQALLDSDCLKTRGQRLLEVIEFHLAEAGLRQAAPDKGRSH